MDYSDNGHGEKSDDEHLNLYWPIWNLKAIRRQIMGELHQEIDMNLKNLILVEF